MPDIYEQHDAAFKQVSAFVITKDDEHVATVAIKFPKDGASRLYAYVHWSGLPMVRGSATGYGYDKRSAAVADALKRIARPAVENRETEPGMCLCEFVDTGAAMGGQDWTRALEKAGFTVWQAV